MNCTITLQNKNGRIMRVYESVDMPNTDEYMEKALDYIWLGLSTSCTVGRIIVTSNLTRREVANKVYFLEGKTHKPRGGQCRQ